MGKFKLSKGAYIKKLKKNRDWNEEQEKSEERRSVNKTFSCHRYEDIDGNRAFSKPVKIKDSVCSASATCRADCSYR